MRAFYKKLFDIKDNDRISDKQMLMRVITTISVIVVCLVAMSVVAYSYYNLSIQTGSSTVSLAKSKFKVTVTAEGSNSPVVIDDHGDPTVEDVSYSTYNGGYYTDVTLNGSNESYKITITIDGLTDEEKNAIGFCTVRFKSSFDNSQVYNFETIPLGRIGNDDDDNDYKKSMTFYVKTPALTGDSSLKLTIGSCWGSSAKDVDKICDDMTYEITSLNESHFSGFWSNVSAKAIVDNTTTDVKSIVSYDNFITDVNLTESGKKYKVKLIRNSSDSAVGYYKIFVGNRDGYAIKTTDENYFVTVPFSEFGVSDGVSSNKVLEFYVQTRASGVSDEKPVTLRIIPCRGSVESATKVSNDWTYNITGISNNKDWTASWVAPTTP